ncbi:Retrovirus-related Pol polyprotein from transposon 17.6 [Anthophora retusa]
MVDTGSEPNLIKFRALKPHLSINATEALAISGITDGQVKTYGSVRIQVHARKIPFQVVPDDFPIDTEGILGSQFCNRNVDILYSQNCLVWENIRIPFANTPDITIPPRTSKCVAVNIRSKHPSVGVIPRLDVAPGVYLGNALVANRRGKAYTRVFNTTNKQVQIPTPSTELEEISLAGYDIPTTRVRAFRDARTMGSKVASRSRAYQVTNRDIAGSSSENTAPHSSAISPVANSARDNGYDNVHTPRDSTECAERSNTTKSTNSTKSTRSANSNKSTNSTKSTRSANSTKSTYSTKSTRSANSTKSTNSTNSTNPTNSTKSTNSPISTEPRKRNESSTSPDHSPDQFNKERSGSPNLPITDNNPAAFPCESDFFPENRSTVFCSRESVPRPERVKQLLRLEHLNAEELSAITSLIDKNHDLFYLPGDRLGKTDAVEHRIPTINQEHIHVKQYRYPPIHREEVTKQITELLENDIIKPSNSPYNSPLWVVPKKPDSQGNKRWRMVIDYRSLNENSVADAYPLPNITEILDQLGSAKYFSTFDLASGFHQIGIAEKDAEKTAFSTPYGHYQFNRMPFGLRNAPSTFQRLMDSVLSGLQGNEMFVYLDDIVIYASSLTEHNIKFNKLAERLRKANLSLQPDKCEFLRKEVAYLGHVIGRDGVKPDPRNIEAVRKFPVPKTAKNIKQFLGLAGYYRRFIPKFSHIAKPLTSLLKKDAKFEWNREQEKAFTNLRDMLCTEPILQYPDFAKPFIVTTDASGYAVGAVLSQGNVGKDLPIAYASRLLNGPELNYATIEKECLAIMYAVQYFRPYLYGREFLLVTDHRPLVWMHSVKDPSSRLVRWRLKLAEFEYKIIYKEGKVNMNADALSRNPVQILPLTIENESTDDDALFAPRNARRPRRSPTDTVASPTAPTPPPLDVTRSPPAPMDSSPIDRPPISPYHYSSDSLMQFPSATDLPSHSAHLREPDDDTDSTSDEEIFIADDQPFLLRHRLITETRDRLEMRKDNTVYFTTMDGEPIGTPAADFLNAHRIAKQPGILLNRARVTRYNKTKYAIALPIKLNERDSVNKTDLTEALESLSDVTTELEIKSVAIAKAGIDDISWPSVKEILIQIFHDKDIKFIVCQGLTRVPLPEERGDIISEYHTSAFAGHKGVNKTYSRIREKYYWGTMKTDIQKFIQNCQSCQLQKLTRQKTRQPMTLTDTPGSAFDKISMDIVGPLPTTPDNFSYILTIQDLLTKYSVAAPLRQATAVDVADAFISNFICKHGAPKALITDQGSHFINGLFKTIAKRFRITHYKTTAFHPQSNGSIERSHHVLAEYLKHFISSNQDWNAWLPMAMFSYNTSVHESTQFTPHELVYGKLARVPSTDASPQDLADESYTAYLRELNLRIYETQLNAKDNLNRAKQKYKYYYDRKLKTVSFKVGDKVFLLKEPRKGKFDAQYTGPYEITEILDNHNVRLRIRNKFRIVHTNKLKMCKYSK